MRNHTVRAKAAASSTSEKLTPPFIPLSSSSWMFPLQIHTKPHYHAFPRFSKSNQYLFYSHIIMADVEDSSTAPTEPQSRNVTYCGGKLIGMTPLSWFSNWWRGANVCVRIVCSLPPEVGFILIEFRFWVEKFALRTKERRDGKIRGQDC